jgi:methenyltetrahydromethanopterin cyclohydrolase
MFGDPSIHIITIDAFQLEHITQAVEAPFRIIVNDAYGSL